MKICVCGYSGSGKSTLAKYLADSFDIPLLYLDTVQYKENWVDRSFDECISIIGDFLLNDSWVIDGNYSRYLHAQRYEQSDYIIYLKFNRFSCLKRVIERYIKNKGSSRESITKGCNEKIDREFLWWIIYKGRRKKVRNGFKRMRRSFNNKLFVIKNQYELDTFIKNYSTLLKDKK